MKQLLSALLFVFLSGAALSQCTIYSLDRSGSNKVKKGKVDNKIIYRIDAAGKSTKAGKIDNNIIYSTDRKGLTPVKKGKIEDGIIYSTNAYGTEAVKVGKIDKGFIYSTDSYGLNPTLVGKVEGDGCEEGGALILLLVK